VAIFAEKAIVRPSIARLLIVAFVLGLCPDWSVAEDGSVPARLHPWGLFEPGAWKTVHVVTETLNDRGQVVSTCTTDTKTTLMDIDTEGVTLEIRACLEVAGKRFEAEPQTIKQGFHGVMVGPGLKTYSPTDGEAAIEGRKIPCQIQQFDSAAPNGITTTTIYYSITVPPFVLKRTSTITDPEGKNVLSETTVEVIALNMPLTVRGETRNGIKMRTVRKNANGGALTAWSDVLPEVPGGVVGDSTKEIDKSGRLIRRSTLNLMAYGTVPEDDRSPIFNRRRPPRHRKMPP
jgi:hypothetical protein